MRHSSKVRGQNPDRIPPDVSAVSDSVPRRGRRVDDAGREELSQSLAAGRTRRDALKLVVAGGGAALAAVVADRTIGRAIGAPGDAIGGTTISNTDIDAKRIAAIRIATEFDSAKHAGTSADPWTGAGIVGAMADLGSAGGLVFLPSGVYRVNPISVPGNNISLMGSGFATQLVANPAGYTPNDPINGTMIVINGRLGVTVSDMALDGTGTDTCYGVIGTGGSDPILSRLKLTNWLGTLSNRARGISFQQNPSSGPPFREGIIQNCVFNGNQIGVVVHRTTYMIIGCRADSNAFDGFYIDGNQAQGSMTGNMTYNNARSGINAVFSERSTLADNTSYHDATAIQLYSATRMLVHGNTINESTANGILVNATTKYSAITGNWIHDLSSSGVSGIVLYNGCLHNLVQGNVIGQAARNGILVNLNSDENTIADNVCFDNSATDSGYSGIAVATVHNHLFGNKCFDDQATKRQAWGIQELTGADSNYIHHNDLRNNLTGALHTVGANTLAERNLGVDINI